MQKTCSPAAAERELYRYFQPDPACEDFDQNGKPVPQSSCDPCMTAFAQLGALRLNAKRGIIILSAKDSEYMLAEAGRTLTLQEANDEHDALWHGVGAITRNHGLGRRLVEHFRNPRTDSPCLVINDLTKHPEYKDNELVVDTPFVRFLAAVPLRASNKSTVIGTFTVIDDVPRHGLSEDEIEYLIDMGTTVMDYLEAGRAKQKQYRAERMIKALGLFVEGKESMRDWWLSGGHNLQESTVRRLIQRGITLERRADIEFGVQESDGTSLKQGIETLNGRPMNATSSASSTLTPASVSDQTPSLLESTANTTIESEAMDLDHQSDYSSNETSKRLQEDLVSSDVKSVFARASNLIREGTQIEGVVVYDASIGSFGGKSKREGFDEKAPGNVFVKPVASRDTSSSEENAPKVVPRSHVAAKSISEESAGKTCNILGYSTRSRSSLKGHLPSESLRKFPEEIMRRLLKQYPHGKVFNFDEHGSISSSDSDGAPAGTDGQPPSSTDAKSRRIKYRMSKETEAAAILSALPGARSVFFYPLWDPAKERWFAGSFMWSTIPSRVLCPHEDLTYMASFSNSVMAEVSRLAAVVSSRMKSDFIASVSHELRSPLHGVLASVEFLQETNMTEMQADMVNNISSSGRVLLDTINHLLDFSNVNKKMKEKPRRIRKKGRKRTKERSRERGSEPEKDDVEDVEDVCVLSEEVINSVYTGRSMGRLAHEVSGSVTTHHIQTPVTVIMDIAYRSHFMFEVDAGAWRRILMNLFNNAMKYTDTGFVKVSLKIEDEPNSQGRKPRSNLFLKVSDSGKGISQEFLKHHIFKPFSQEDALAVGTGLGLSIVRQIVHDMGGDIYLTSEKGTGTEAMVRLPLMPSPPSSISEHFSEFLALRKQINGLKASFVGFDRYPEISETPTGILSTDSQAAMLLKSSVKSMMLEWFGIEETSSSSDKSADLQIIMEAGLDGGALNRRISISQEAAAASSARRMVIVLCSNFIPRKNHNSEFFTVVYFQQPYGPLKFKKALHGGFRKGQSVDSDDGSISPLKSVLQEWDFNKTSSPASHEPATDVSPTTVASPKPVPDKQAREPTNGATTAQSQELAEGLGNITKGMRVLLVEDNVINLKLLVAYMRKLKVEHVTATNGLEALNAYKEARGNFDIAFMDISMPVMSGLESTQHIRGYEQEEGLEPVTIIALTGAANPTARQEAYACGIDVFLTKPMSMKALKGMLEDFKMKGRDGLEQ